MFDQVEVFLSWLASETGYRIGAGREVASYAPLSADGMKDLLKRWHEAPQAAPYDGTERASERLQDAVTAYAADRSTEKWWEMMRLFEGWRSWMKKPEEPTAGEASAARLNRLIAIGEAVEAAIERAVASRETNSYATAAETASPALNFENVSPEIREAAFEAAAQLLEGHTGGAVAPYEQRPREFGRFRLTCGPKRGGPYQVWEGDDFLFEVTDDSPQSLLDIGRAYLKGEERGKEKARCGGKSPVPR